MSNLNNIIWIDDDQTRETTANEIGAVFVNVTKDNVGQKLNDFFGADEPRIVILDHFLNVGSQIFDRGSTLAEAIKERWPSCPVIGITAADIGTINRRTRHAYDELFEYTSLGAHLPKIAPIAEGFDKINELDENNADNLIILLSPPDDEKGRLIDALPESLKKLALDASAASTFYQWVRHLRDRAGFLYDELWAATIIGLNEGGLAKVKDLFEEAKYTGIFCLENDPRCWSSLLIDLLYKNVKPETEQFTWHLGRKLPNVSEENFSICFKCEKPFPEIVAYLDRESNERYAMHLECTVLHPSYKKELFFEDVRMMDGN